MAEDPLVSVLMLTYNHEKFVAQAIESVLMQQVNYKYEIVIGEDCSTDRTRDIIVDFKNQYGNNIKLILQEKNTGGYKNSTDAYNACRGKYIALLEGDDYWTDPHKLQKQVEFLEKNPDFAICFHNMQIIYEDELHKNCLSNINQQEITNIEELASCGNYIYTASCFFRKFLSELPDWIYQCPVGDYPIHLLNAQYGKIKFIDEVMGVYRVHKGGMWENKSWIYRMEKWLEMLEIIKDKFDEDTNKILNNQLLDSSFLVAKHYLNNCDYEKYKIYLMKIIDNNPYYLVDALMKINAEHSCQLDNLNQVLAKRDGQLSNLNQTIAESGEQIANLESVIRDKDAQIGSLNQTQAELDERFSSLNQTLTESDAKISRLNQAIVARNGQIEALYSSLSWRITQPLRTIYSFIFGRLWQRNIVKKPMDGGKSFILDEEMPVGPRLLDSLLNTTISARILHSKYKPKVTVIVPNYNHAIFLRQRLDSIYGQTYDNYEVILLDDNSSDNSRNILLEYEKKSNNTRCIFNEKNSGSVFSQWRKGLAESNGELIWIAESDDFCDENFLEKIVPFFADEAVMLGYAYSLFVDENNRKASFAFDAYLSEISISKWQSSYVETAHREVKSALAIKNTIPNVSSAVFRRPNGQFPLFKDDTWLSMEICGDWIFYLNIIKGGKIAYCRETKNFYRIHPYSSSKKTHKKDTYYKEHEQVMCRLVSMYRVDDTVVRQNRDIIKRFYFSNVECSSENKFQNLYDYNKVLNNKKARTPNILMVIYSFSIGGGEILPIRLANALHERGVAVTIMNGGFDEHNDGIRKMLYPQIPVVNYHSQLDLSALVRDFGIECIHTHHAAIEKLIAFSRLKKTQNILHVATMHGMYEMMKNFSNEVKEIIKSVDHWFYIADKNIMPFKKYGYYENNKFSKMNNGMNVPTIKPIDRRELGIDEDAFVACLASRAMPEKGWREAIRAVSRARKISNKNIHLILIGEGIIYEQLKKENIPLFIHLLGFKSNVVDYFASSNVCLLPSYFKGESVPLTIIESFMAGKPVVASDIGEVSNMITDFNNKRAGIAVELLDGKVSEKKFADAIVRMVNDEEFYQECIETVKNVKNKFVIDNVANRYIEIYRQIAHG